MKTVICHGEGRTIEYIVDETQPEEMQPAIVSSRVVSGR